MTGNWGCVSICTRELAVAGGKLFSTRMSIIADDDRLGSVVLHKKSISDDWLDEESVFDVRTEMSCMAAWGFRLDVEFDERSVLRADIVLFEKFDVTSDAGNVTLPRVWA